MFSVTWMEVALNSLLEAMSSADGERRELIERSVIRLHALLEHDPYNFGESREGSRRVGFDGNCGITFWIEDSPDTVVRITHFWTY